MQRPTHISNEANTKLSLGKRDPLPTLEYSRSRKRRAALGNDSSTPLTSNGGGWQVAPPITISLLLWNVRRLGNQRTAQELKGYIQAQDPIALFLAKTWAGEARLINLCAELGFDQH